MFQEKDILDQIILWASAQPTVAVCLLVGSRAGVFSSVDALSDYDFEVYVEDLEPFKNDDHLPSFGNVVARFSETKPNQLTRLILFHSGVRIDFQMFLNHVYAEKLLLPALQNDWDAGVRMLYKRDQAIAHLPAASGQRYILSPPSAAEYLQVVSEFWWDTTYVAKSLCRDELWTARYMLDSVIRINYFQKMIEWHIGLMHDWKINPGKAGRDFKKYLSDDLWQRVVDTFACSHVGDTWAALFAMTDIFQLLAKNIAEHLRINYPLDLENNTLDYLMTLKRSS